ncbi:MAG: hypothetical protein KKH28_06395, partial [Elusimicrobia bacterium]|nr:hypothetical protein [Elusimicrobiota bacterium]
IYFFTAPPLGTALRRSFRHLLDYMILSRTLARFRKSAGFTAAGKIRPRMTLNRHPFVPGVIHGDFFY